MQPANTMYAKVTVKAHPCSEKPISILIASAMFPDFTLSKALLFSELPLHVSLGAVESAIKTMQGQCNAESAIIKIAKKVQQFLAE